MVHFSHFPIYGDGGLLMDMWWLIGGDMMAHWWIFHICWLIGRDVVIADCWKCAFWLICVG